jgi:hypothetical protein
MLNDIYFTIKYEPEADVLFWEVSNKPIDHAREIGNIVVHFDYKDNPVLLEVLEAKGFQKELDMALSKKNHVYA